MGSDYKLSKGRSAVASTGSGEVCRKGQHYTFTRMTEEPLGGLGTKSEQKQFHNDHTHLNDIILIIISNFFKESLSLKVNTVKQNAT